MQQQRRLIQLLTIKQVLDHSPLIVQPNTLINEVVAQMSRVEGSICELSQRDYSTQSNFSLSPIWQIDKVKAYSYALVVEEEKLIGIFTEQDVVKLAASGFNDPAITIAEVMNQPAIALTESECPNVFFALSYLRQHRIRHLPLLDEQGKLLGIVTFESIRQALQAFNWLRFKQVSEVMNTEGICASETTSLQDLAHLMTEKAISCVVIRELNTSKPIGIITERDIVKLQALGLNLGKTKAQTVMSSPLVRLNPQDSLWHAYQQMQQHQLRRLVVTDKQGQLIGLIDQTILLEVFDPLELLNKVEDLQQILTQQTNKLRQINQQLDEEMAKGKHLETALKEANLALAGKLDLTTANLWQTKTALQQKLKQYQRLLGVYKQRKKEIAAIFEKALDAIVTLDDRGRLVTVNPAACQLLAITSEELVGYSLANFLEPEVDFVSRWHGFLAQGQETGEIKILLPDGSSKEVEYSAIANFIPHRHLIILRDITVRKQAEIELKRSKQQLQYLITTSLAVLYRRRGDTDYNITFISENVSNLLGYEAKDFLNNTDFWQQHIHPADLNNVCDLLDYQNYGREYRFRDKNGSYRWIYDSFRPIYNEQGNLLEVVGYWADIHQRKEAEEALRQSEERWQLAISGSNDGIWDWDLKTNQCVLSPRCWEMLGYSAEEITSFEQWKALIHPEDRQKMLMTFQAHLDQLTPYYSAEYRMQCQDRTYKWILCRGQAIWEQTNIAIRAVGSITDISDRKRREEIISNIASGVAAETGEAFFQSLVEYLTKALQVEYALIGELMESNKNYIRTIAIYGKGQKMENFTYNLQQTPCESVMEGQLCIYNNNVQQSFPHDLVLKNLDVQGYMVMPIFNSAGETLGLIAILSCSPLKDTPLMEEVFKIFAARASAELERRKVTAKIEHQHQREQLLAEITRKIRQSLKIEEILQTTVTEVQKLLKCDRVVIMQLESDRTVIPLSETVLPELPSMLGWRIADPLLQNDRLEEYRRGGILAISNINEANLLPENKQLLAQFAIKAKLVVPILSQERLKGLLVAHQCAHPRHWQQEEINLLKQLADQISVAISQAQLLSNLEEMVADRTFELTAANQQLKQEIRERELTEAALRESEQKLAGILEYADEAIISINENQIVQLFNRGAEKIFGYSRDEVLGQPLDLLIPESLRTLHRQHIRGFGNSPIQARTMTDRDNQVFGRRKNGQEFPADASISKLSSRGGLIFTVMLKDITERKAAEAAIRRSEEQLRLITNALPILIAYIDAQQYYRFNNQAHEDWFGISCEQINGLQLQDVIGKKAYQMISPYVDIALAGQSITFEVKLPSKNSHFRWVNATYIPDFESSGEVKGFFATLNDISDRKEIDQMKSEFVSIASHEMRTPLTSIKGVLQLLAAERLGTLPKSGAEMVKIALKNTDRLVRLVNDVLDLERLESKRVVMERQLCQAADLIQQAAETIQAMAEQEKITICVTAADTPITFWADPDQIIQTLTNLLSNAIKFSPENSTVWLKAENQGDRVLFQVQDRGKGIPTDKLETIFERFQQVDASDSRRKGGTGLGLAICRQIIQQHGGQIWAKSTLAKGTTFYFTLPTVNINSPKSSNRYKP
jgi:PAS domain S-box-containing protein